MVQTSERVITGVIDGDGHFMEHDEDLYPYFDHQKHPVKKLRNYYLFPDLDGFRREGQGGYETGDDAQGWLDFMDASHMSSAVLYPTAGLAFAYVRSPEWAIDLSRAYNDFMADRYQRVSPRLKGVALLPVQDPEAAAIELRRAVQELGLVGGLLPSPGLLRPYGDPAFDVLYKEAQSLGVMLGVHGASFRDLGLDFPQSSHAGVARPGFRYAHPAQPLTQMIQFANMMCEQVWVRFPELKVAFLETGCAWAPYWIERIDHRAGTPIASEQMANSPIYFHTELDELQGLKWFVSLYGDERVTYASDFPHEPDHEVVEKLEDFFATDEVSQQTKEHILRDNIKALYNFD
jgi:predicted TIM-barrel fold metal-dependent hydrolase